MKRTYQAQNRKQQAINTKTRILEATKKLLISFNYNDITVPQIAATAGVSTPTIYSLFKSKLGILKSLLDSATDAEKFSQLVIETKSSATLEEKLAQAAKMTSQIYSAEQNLINTLNGLTGISNELSLIQKELEERRYSRQEEMVKLILGDIKNCNQMELQKARDIFWALTSRNFYQLLVAERLWKAEEFENFLKQILVNIFRK
ncbi:TetR/AcrR family transcriptional regulator [Pigmentibacter sp. JX0631]|uniref:TetR/AcrR family transcriptional regulator n=1 Tax=Pigmentibacter sp. JX0631 TaxID=2976982 RepID=UPI0024689206|nr:TetR/AcrR family transcriptional regulator [Pigmentibacter sp. JX0631]WGL60304.1 TetR/AcrR family transcriptional regulator [Pigmentibacter sp. JX0631]